MIKVLWRLAEFLGLCIGLVLVCLKLAGVIAMGWFAISAFFWWSVPVWAVLFSLYRLALAATEVGK